MDPVTLQTLRWRPEGDGLAWPVDWKRGVERVPEVELLLDRDLHRDTHRGALGRAPTQHEAMIARKAQFIEGRNEPLDAADREGFVDAVFDRWAPQVARNPSERPGCGIGDDDIVGIRLPVIAIQNAYHGRHSVTPRRSAKYSRISLKLDNAYAEG